MGHLKALKGPNSLKTVQNGVKTARKRVFKHPKLPKWIPSQDTAGHQTPVMPRDVMSRGHRAPFGAVLGPNDTDYGVKTGKTRQKEPRTLLKWIPSQDTATRPHRRPSWSSRAPLGAVWGRSGAKLANERPPQAENTLNGVQQDP